ncbi:LysR family transcriptional regulator [Mesorhizobium sp. ES1-4]|uniref:LysR family transcriptional regulator n=1 Tax=Mesorhizobium sp. ES1-4 TaxID=2876627 RepID=UPI001CD02295|nr:LysR family transcriptional regulator [Mesorhizobium sp. ES1-4]MBZ9798439.1 LysR family transcriptional regulator [Mesorhizobium sp. ES1-4]
MDTRFIESFLAVVETGSIAAASRRLNLTQAALAQRLKALERDIGVPLVSRVGQTVKPTSAGLSVIERSQELLSTVRQIRSIAMEDANIGELRLGAISAAMIGIIPTALGDFCKSLPNVTVHLTPGVSEALYQQVLDDALDAAIIIRPHHFAIPKTCSWQLLLEEEFIVLKSAAIAADDGIELLREHPLIRYDRRHWDGQIADRYMTELGIQPQERFEMDGIDAIAALVEKGLGVSLVPNSYPLRNIGSKIVKVPLGGGQPFREIIFISNRSSPNSRFLEIFFQCAKASVAASRCDSQGSMEIAYTKDGKQGS